MKYTSPPTDNALLTIDPEQRNATLALSGDWTVNELRWHESTAPEPLPSTVTRLTVDGTDLGAVDTSGAWLIVARVRGLQKQNVELEWQNIPKGCTRIIALINGLDHKSTPHKQYGTFYEGLMKFGIAATRVFSETKLLFSFFGQFCLTLLAAIKRPRGIRWRSIVYHVNEIGINATPITLLMAFLISIVLGYQGATQLKLFGATIFTVNLVAITVLREMGVLITSILVAGRSSSAFAAQIGVMQMNEEVAALRTTGLDPFELLILPRVIAIIIALPVLTFLADIAGLIGTYIVASVQLDMTFVQFMVRLKMAVKAHSFYVGLIKAPFFGLLIGMVGCMQGMQVKSSATELGARTTAAVVQAIFLVILADALFSVLFTKVGY